MMKRMIQQTNDGSFTVIDVEKEITYHSIHGAEQESKHVFIQAGLEFIANQKLDQINLLEMGFGTGLNAWLTLEWNKNHSIPIYYETIEKFPLSNDIIEAYARGALLSEEYLKLHRTEWNQWETIHTNFHLYKHLDDIIYIEFKHKIDLVYYDAFAPTAQPELWTTEIFEKLYRSMNDKGVLVTYCAKGDVKRALKAVGFVVEALPGPPRKREMIRALKK